MDTPIRGTLLASRECSTYCIRLVISLERTGLDPLEAQVECRLLVGVRTLLVLGPGPLST
jgi:hypothetical protein